ncbi:MFS family permease [Paraburkholderia sp. GAS199]|uniref:tricarballylate/proton symporter TcuC n=1 Tax=Paraburkholderia sp. GAS199 TaxID=3035126 RepID=UPI003D1D0BE2
MDIPARTESPARTILRVVSGNFLEMYDFMVYGLYATSIAKAMFPSDDPLVSLLLSLATFGMGFLMRPLGAIVLGAYIDRCGRRAGLIVTLTLMSIGITLIAVTPTYAAIGLAAPVLVLIGRLLQGFSAGAESAGASIYLAEIAPPGRRGFYVSWQSATQQLGVLMAAVLGVGLRFALTPEQMDSWGWRVPMLVGCSIIPVLVWIRRSIVESHVFTAQKRQTTSELFLSLARCWRTVLWATLLISLTPVMFILITVYTPTYGLHELGLRPIDTFWVTTCVASTTFIMIPLMAIVSDKVGRKPMLAGSALAIAVVAYPAMQWLVAAPSFGALMIVEVGFALLYSGWQASLVVAVTEIIPDNIRGTGFSLAYSLSVAIFGGFTPFMCTAMIHVTGNKAVPGAWLAVAAMLAFIASLGATRPQRVADDERASAEALT